MLSEQTDSVWVRAEALFQKAWELDASARPAFLAESCQGDQQLRQVIEDLLRAAAEAEANPLWQESAIRNEARFMAAGNDATALGRYRLLERLGAGGMAVVYKAIRADDEFSKLVAVKIVQDNDPALTERMRQERQILAALEHPNIARLLDGGTTADGRPFLVMEYVDGDPLDRYVTRRQPGLREILELFQKVCAAVSYAHRNLIVHRDLKPANILVAADGQPKLLDFGIAKLLDGSSQRTKTGAGAMTPEYASPEQVLGSPITTASDIYSLGVILYELLSGARPYRQTASPLELAQAITGEEPLPLGSHAGRSIDADLENIVRMALRKEPGRRYVSADQLSDDLRRYMDGYPVTARTDTRGYRLARFVGRHRVSLAAAAAALVMLIALSFGMFVQWREAQRRFADVRSLSGRLIFDVYDSIQYLPGSLAARQKVAGIAREYLDRLAAGGTPDDALRLELATAYRKLGDLEGEPYGGSLNDSRAALESYHKARTLLEARRTSDLQLAVVYQQIGRIQVRSGHPDIGCDWQRKAMPLFEKAHREHPADSDATAKLAMAYLFLGQAEFGASYVGGRPSGLSMTSIYQLALGDYLRGADVVKPLLGRGEKSAEFLRIWSVAQEYATYSMWGLGDSTGDRSYYARACNYAARAVDAAERSLAANPGKLNFERTLADVECGYGESLRRAGNEPDAIRHMQRGLKLFNRLMAENRDDQELVLQAADARGGLGRLLERNQPAQAIEQYRTVLGMLTHLANANPTSMELVRLLKDTRERLAELLVRTGQRDAGEAGSRPE